jgi:hypothetical protein
MKDYPILNLDTNLQLFSRRVMNSSLLFGTHHFPPKKLQRMHQWDSSKLYPTTQRNIDCTFKAKQIYYFTFLAFVKLCRKVHDSNCQVSINVIFNIFTYAYVHGKKWIWWWVVFINNKLMFMQNKHKFCFWSCCLLFWQEKNKKTLQWQYGIILW